MRVGLILSDGRRVSLARARYLVFEHGQLDGWPPEAIVLATDVREPKHVGVWDCASGALRKVALQVLCPHYVSLSTLYFLIRGRVVHGGCEGIVFPPGESERAMQELWLSTTLPNGIEIVGRPDRYCAKRGLLRERKTATMVKRADLPKLHHLRQAHAYQYLLERHGLPVRQIYIDYWGWKRVYSIPVAPYEDVAVVLEWLEPAAEILHKALFAGWPRRIPARQECLESACRYCPVAKFCQALPDEACEMEETEWQAFLNSLTS